MSATSEEIGQQHHELHSARAEVQSRIERLLADPAYAPLGVVQAKSVHPMRLAFVDDRCLNTVVFEKEADDSEQPSSDHIARDHPWMIDSQDE